MTAAPTQKRGVEMTICEPCNTSIVRVRAAATGKLMAFESDASGEWVIDGDTARYVGRAPATPIEGVATVQRWASHFSHCPYAPARNRSR